MHRNISKILYNTIIIALDSLCYIYSFNSYLVLYLLPKGLLLILTSNVLLLLAIVLQIL